MAKVIIDVGTESVFQSGQQFKETVSINICLDGVNYEEPAAADRIAYIIKQMGPTIIQAAHQAYLEQAGKQCTVISGEVKFSH